MNKRIVSFFFLLLFAGSLYAAIGITDLRTEQLKNPAGIDVRQPRLSWRIESDEQNVIQTAYHILVASSPELLEQGKGDIWDSGKIESDASQWITYQGKTLKCNAPYYWRVKIDTNKGATNWSAPAFWTTGLFNEADWQGQWIGLDRAAPGDSETQWSRLAARYLRKEFAVKKSVKRATVHIAGMGLYELFINGQRIGNQVLAPAPTDYRKTILYNTYDVTSLLQTENAIGVTLGNGRFYTMRQNYKPYKIPTFGYPKLRLNLIVEYADGSKETIATNTSWKLTTEGPIRSNNEYDGEEYDARKELGAWTQTGYDDNNWMPAQRVSIPSGTLRAQMMPGMKVTETLKPVSIKKLGNKYILDIGQNMAGWVRFRIKGQAGDSIRLRFAESLQDNGELYTRNFRDARSTDVYVVSGRETKDATWPCTSATATAPLPHPLCWMQPTARPWAAASQAGPPGNGCWPPPTAAAIPLTPARAGTMSTTSYPPTAPRRSPAPRCTNSSSPRYRGRPMLRCRRPRTVPPVRPVPPGRRRPLPTLPSGLH